MPTHPQIIIDHPMANKTEAQMHPMAEDAVDAIATALTGQ